MPGRQAAAALRTGTASLVTQRTKDLPSNFPVQQLIATASPWSGVTDVIITDGAERLQHCRYTPWEGRFSDWTPMTSEGKFVLTGVINAVRSPTRLDLFARGATGQLWRRVWR